MILRTTTPSSKYIKIPLDFPLTLELFMIYSILWNWLPAYTETEEYTAPHNTAGNINYMKLISNNPLPKFIINKGIKALDPLYAKFSKDGL